MVSSGVGFVAACALGVAACTEPESTSFDEQFAVACADGPTVKGMDVSYWEMHGVDWDAAHAAGIDFAFIRVSDGLQFLDPRFSEYWVGARAAGVIRGAYQFFRPAQDPIAQADLLLEHMGPLQPGDLVPVLDVEDRDSGLTPTQIAASVRRWIDHVTPKIGRAPIVYAGLYSWAELTGSLDVAASPLWVAQYTTAACPNIPEPWTRWAFWQYTAEGTVPGVPGNMLDLNVFNGTLDDLRAFTQPGPCGDDVCSGSETADSCAHDCAPCGVIGSEGGVIDDGDSCFFGGGPQQYLREVADTGNGGDLLWTYTTASPGEVSFAEWRLYLAEPGRYRVEAYTARDYAGSKRAAYVIKTGAASTTVTVDQTAVDGWQSLGEHDLAAGGRQSIHLGDNTGEPGSSKAQLVLDAIRLTRIHPADPPSPPSPPPADPPSPPVPPPGPGSPGGPVEIGGCATADAKNVPVVLVALAILAGLAPRRRRSRAAG